MKTKLALVAILSLLTLQVFAQGERPETRKQVEAFFAKFDQNINTNNMQGLFSMFDPSYYSVDTQGKRTTFAQWKAAVVGASKATKDTKSKIQIKNVQLQDKEIVAWIQQQISYKVNVNGRWVTKISTSRWAETLRDSGNGLKSMSSQELITNEPWTFKTNGGG